MKKTTKILTVLLCALILCPIFACSPKNSDIRARIISSDDSGTVIIEATATSGSLYDALAMFDESDLLDLDMEQSEYGYFIEEVNGRKPDAAKNEFFAVYTSLGDYLGVSYSSEEFASYEYNGQRLGSASVGVSSLPLVKGEIYIIAISTYLDV